MAQSSSPVRSLVTITEERKEAGVEGSGAGHHHLMGTGPALDRGSNADDRIGSAPARLTDCAVEGGVARAIEDVAEFLDFAPREGFQRAEYAAAHADGISDVAEHMLDRLIARVHVTK